MTVANEKAEAEKTKKQSEADAAAATKEADEKKKQEEKKADENKQAAQQEYWLQSVALAPAAQGRTPPGCVRT